LQKHIGYNAVPVMMIFYVMIHLSKPLPECLGAMAGALVLGIVSLHMGSIWLGVFCHLALAWSMDLWAVFRSI